MRVAVTFCRPLWMLLVILGVWMVLSFFGGGGLRLHAVQIAFGGILVSPLKNK